MIAASLALLAAKDRISPRRHGDTEKSEINEQQIQNFDHRGHRGQQRIFWENQKTFEPRINANKRELGNQNQKFNHEGHEGKDGAKPNNNPYHRGHRGHRGFLGKSKNL